MLEIYSNLTLCTRRSNGLVLVLTRYQSGSHILSGARQHEHRSDSDSTHLVLQTPAEGLAEIFCNLLNSNATHRADGESPNEGVLSETNDTKRCDNKVNQTLMRLYLMNSAVA